MVRVSQRCPNLLIKKKSQDDYFVTFRVKSLQIDDKDDKSV